MKKRNWCNQDRASKKKGNKINKSVIVSQRKGAGAERKSTAIQGGSNVWPCDTAWSAKH